MNYSFRFVSSVLYKLFHLNIFFQGLNPAENYKVIMVMFLLFLVFLGFCYSGQQITDTVYIKLSKDLKIYFALLQFENIHVTICSTNWVYWNVSNRKLLLILLPNTARKVENTMAGLIALNYPLLLSVSVMDVQQDYFHTDDAFISDCEIKLQLAEHVT